ncbi:hypothetical protein HMPREF1705_03809 [Acetomicrobium hydrogeniformans ATCC BAA-1850]|uniref:Uncharacterized protein n=1 Tax=Acetomicrobium hydrogeniformans ATCC BAA-1850 TaxID=592015 RepID=A0A0T5X8F5_9BACT|nr:hypothetical protein HMPREF1705_03809 [Acetomicrobium hydrogeniformans ATCC BAA-1850]
MLNIQKDWRIDGQAKLPSNLAQFLSNRSPIKDPIVILLKNETTLVGKEIFTSSDHNKAVLKRGPNTKGAGKRNCDAHHATHPPVPNRKNNPNR